MDGDPAFGDLNPSLDNATMDNRISFNYAPYVSGINFGYAGYAKTFDSIQTTFDAGVQFISYGSFQGTDEFGNLTNTFSGGEYSIHVGGAYHFGGNFYAGANLNFITSHLESYSSLILKILSCFQNKQANLCLTGFRLRQIEIQLRHILLSTRP